MIKILFTALNVLLLGSVSCSYLATSGAGSAALASFSALGFDHGTGSKLPRSTPSVVARSSPLYAQAYFTRGLAFHRAGDLLTSTSLVEHALHLDPRMAEARLWMAMRHFAEGRPSEGISQLLVVHRLRRNLANQLAAIMAEAAKDRETRLIIAGRLRDTPLILEILRRASADLEVSDLRELISATDLNRVDGGVILAQQAIMRRSLERNDYTTAYIYWKMLLANTQQEGWLFDGDFGDIEASAPFNWSITNDAGVSSRRLRLNIGRHSTGMELRSFSSSPLTLAEQTTLLRPGTYTLHALMRSDSRDEPTFAWRVQCRSGLVLLDTTILANHLWQSHGVVFEVPRNCLHQEVQIVSHGAGDAQGDWLQITGVSIDSRLEASLSPLMETRAPTAF